MRTQPDDLDPTLLQETLAQFWGLDDLALTYQPVGFGSHHWSAKATDGRRNRWFVTVDDHRKAGLGVVPEASFDRLDRAMQTTTALHNELGLDFVVAPIPDHTGEVIRRVGETAYSIALFPYLDGTSANYGVFVSEPDRLATLGLIGRLHNATTSLTDLLPRRDDLAIPRRHDLLAICRDLDTPWTSGPYGEQTRLLLRESHSDIVQALHVYDELVATVQADPTPWVVTHGEPHAGNVVNAVDGRRLLVDWDTVALGPKERDLWMLLQGAATDWTPYIDVTGKSVLSNTAIRMYRMVWDLSEIAAYVVWFQHVHDDSEDTATGWEGLNACLPIKPEFQAEPNQA